MPPGRLWQARKERPNGKRRHVVQERVTTCRLASGHSIDWCWPIGRCFDSHPKWSEHGNPPIRSKVTRNVPSVCNSATLTDNCQIFSHELSEKQWAIGREGSTRIACTSTRTLPISTCACLSVSLPASARVTSVTLCTSTSDISVF